MNEETLLALRNKLPRGAVKELSKTTGITRVSISRILHGHWRNDQVINEAIAIIKRHEAKQEEEAKRLLDALNS